MFRLHRNVMLGLAGVFAAASVLAQERNLVDLQQKVVEGSSVALTKLAIYYGEEATPPDSIRAVDLLTIAAIRYSDPIAQLNLGIVYQSGVDGVDADIGRAAYWYGRASEAGNADAQMRLGELYMRGEGTAVDRNKAVNFFTKASDNGFAPAQVELGYMYEMGEFGSVDYDIARMLYEKAAAQGEVIAQYNLAEMYELGKGVDVDKALARQWYTAAAEQGLQEAVEALQRLE